MACREGQEQHKWRYTGTNMIQQQQYFVATAKLTSFSLSLLVLSFITGTMSRLVTLRMSPGTSLGTSHGALPNMSLDSSLGLSLGFHWVFHWVCH